MADYVPFSSNAVEQQPWGPVAGADAGWNEITNDKAKQYALEQMMIQNQQRQAELTRYQGLTPTELAQGRLKEMVANDSAKLPGYGSAIGRGEMGRAGQEQAKGQFALGTVGSDTDLKNSSNKNAGYLNALKYIDMHAPLLNEGLDGQAAYGRLRSGIPESARDILPEAYGPEAKEKLTTIRKHLTDNIEHLQKLSEIGAHTGSAERIATGNNQTSIRVAEINADAKIEAAWARMPPGTKDKVESIITSYLRKIMEGGQPSQDESNAFQAAQQIMYNVRAAGGGADPTMFKFNMLNGQPGQPQPSPQRPVPEPVEVGVMTEQQVKGMGAAYDPKYKYRIGPNGKLQKAPK